MGGRKRQDGDVVIAVNGYSYTYKDDERGIPQRHLTHHLVAEVKYGRKAAEDERVVFVDGDRRNLDPINIAYSKRTDPIASLRRRKVTLEDKMREYAAELDEINKKLKDQGVNL